MSSSSGYSTRTMVTPEYVLKVLRDEHRQISQFALECDPDIELTFDSTIADWRLAQDLLPPRQLGRALNETWEIGLTDAQWRSAMIPQRKKILRDLAELIASHATRVQLKPLQIAGTECLPAAAFLAIKDCLAADGADVEPIAPSTPLEEYARNHWRTFVLRISRLAPGALPDIRIADSFDYDRNLILGCFSAIVALVGTVATAIEPVLFWIPLVSFAILAVTAVMDYRLRITPPIAVTFGRLKTFRDLAKCIAAKAGI